MITDGKRLTDMALSTATLGAFAIPEVGPIVAVGIGVGQLLFDVFYPTPPPAVDPDTLPASKANLSAAITALKKFLVNDQWINKIDDMQADVTNSNTDFLTNWHKMATLSLDILSVDDDAKKYVVADSAEFTTGDLANYFNLGLPKNVPSELGRWIEELTLTGKAAQLQTTAEVLLHRTQTTGLYCLLASLRISYWKALVIWRWSQKHLEWNAWQHYWAQQTWWDGKNDNFHDQYESKRPVQPTLAQGAQPPSSAPDWNSWRLTSDSGVADLLTAVEDALDYAEGTTAKHGVYTTMQANWDKRPQTVADRINKLSIQTDGTSYWYADAASSDSSPKTTHRALAEFQMEGKRGALIAYLWDHWTQEYGLQGVPEEHLNAFAAAIRLWKRARNSVSFSIYEVNAGDTLASIAAAVKYPKGHPKVGKLIYPADARYGWAIYFANRKTLKVDAAIGQQASLIDRVKLEDGQVLAIPDRDAVPFYTVVTGDTLKTISAQHYGSDFYDKALYEVNSTVLKQQDYTAGGALDAGKTLLLPDLSPTTYTVVDDDTFQSISAHFYQYEQYDTLLYEVNSAALPPPAPVSPDWERVTLSTGQVLKPYPDEFGGGTYTVVAGDTLKSVALQFYGTERGVPKIFELNKAMLIAAGAVAPPVVVPSGEHTVLLAGQELQIPDIAAAKFAVYKTVAGDTYEQVVKKCYGPCDIEGTYIDTLNGLNVLAYDPLPQGRILRIPSSLGVPDIYILKRAVVRPFVDDDDPFERRGPFGKQRGDFR